jgi:hypothetical protein
MSRVPEPPYNNLDPYMVIRDPASVPVLVRRGMYNVILRETTGDLREKVVKAFFIIVKGLTESKRLHRGSIMRGELRMAGIGIRREKEVLRDQASKKKIRQIDMWVERLKRQEPDRYTKSWWDE